MFNSLDEYLRYKYINYVIYNPEFLNEISDITNLNYFKEYLEQKIDLNTLSKKTIDNIKTELFELRSIYDEDRSKRIEIINSILIMLNMSKSNKYIDFYVSELNKRTLYNKKAIRNADIFVKTFTSLEELISLDFEVLTSHIDKVSDQEFEEKYLPNYVINENTFLCYSLSLSAILKEYPKIIENKTFYKRMTMMQDIIQNEIEGKEFQKKIK